MVISRLTSQPVTVHAFWVKVTASTSSDFIITSSNRTTNSYNHFRKNDVLTNALILDVSAINGTYKDQLIVYFNQTKLENTEEGAYKLMGNADAPQLWALRSGNRYSIDVYGPEIDQNTVVPVGFKTNISGRYSLAPRFENWVPGMEAWLEDTKTAQWHDFFSGPYLFDHLSDDTSSARFNLHYKGRPTTSQTIETPEIPVIVYTDGDAIKVKITGDPNDGNVTITVWNMLGQSVYQQLFQGGNEFTLSPNTSINGMYLVEVRTVKGVRTVKILR